MSGRVLQSYWASVWVVSPFLFRGLASPLFGVDASALRDEEGRPIIPSDQMRGVVRDAFRVFKSAGFDPLGDDFDAVFGIASHQESTAGAANEPNRARISFTDFAATQLSKSGQGGAPSDAEDFKNTPHEYTRIEIDDVLGAVETGKMQVIELVAPLGAAVKFEGIISVYDSADRKTKWEEWLKKALNHLVAIGGAKSAGFGEVVAGGGAVTAVPPKAAASSTLQHDGRVRLRVTFDRPILIDADLAHDNAFIGKTVLPGAVFKGALAAHLAHQGSGGLALTGDMGAAMSGLIVSHAFPEDAKQPGHLADLPLPLSLVAARFDPIKDVRDEALAIYRDALGHPNGIVLTDPMAPTVRRAALFQGDWKPSLSAHAREIAGVGADSNIPLRPRTHTAIEETSGVAKESQLYSTIARSVLDKSVADEKGKPRTWLIDVDFSLLASASAARAIAEGWIKALLTSGLPNIGKTGATASFEEVKAAPFETAKPIVGKPNRYALVLATPALMTDFSQVEGTRFSQDPRAAYEAYFDGLGFILHDFVAEQAYRGGYLARRRRLFSGHYHPFLVTLSGSVFEVEAKNEAARRKLEDDLIRFGLPPAAVGGGARAIDWRTCPYIRENGYGRITARYLSAGTHAEKLMNGGVHV